MLQDTFASSAPANHGLLQVTVWPAYVGLGEMSGTTAKLDGSVEVQLFEPIDDFDYQRGQIAWATQKDGSIFGRGRVFAPKNRPGSSYTHIIFTMHPSQDVVGVVKLEHPITFDRAGFVDIEPIRNQEYLPRGAF